jgi:hypothetical protein
MPRYSLENQAGAIKSIQQKLLGSSLTSGDRSSTTASINSVDTSRSYIVSGGGSEDMPGTFIQNSTTLFLRWRHNVNHYYRVASTVVEQYGGRGYE